MSINVNSVALIFIAATGLVAAVTVLILAVHFL